MSPLNKILDRVKRTSVDWRYHKAKMQVHHEVQGYSQHLKQNFWTLSISTFGIATGLVWYDVWNTLINEFFPSRNTLDTKILVAIVITLVAITGTYVVTRLQKKSGP